MYFYITTILTLSSMTPLRTAIHSKVEIEVVPTANSHTCRTFYPLYSYFPVSTQSYKRNQAIDTQSHRIFGFGGFGPFVQLQFSRLWTVPHTIITLSVQLIPWETLVELPKVLPSMFV